jgi:hypothetical protein
MRTILIGFAALVAVGALALAGGGSKQVRYIGVHPLPKAEGGGMCYIEGPHVHLFAAAKLEYRDHRGYNYFVGDPVAYGYEGPKHSYKGPHPIQVDVVVGDDVEDVEYCYLAGPHYHYFVPPDSPEFKVVGGAYFYVGAPPKAYLEARATYTPINAYYEPIVYARPVIEVAPPVGWIGAAVVVGGPGVVVAPGAAVVAPHAHVGVEIVAPPPPKITVGVGVSVGVGVGVGVGVRPAPVIIKGKHKHRKHRGRH